MTKNTTDKHNPLLVQEFPDNGRANHPWIWQWPFRIAGQSYNGVIIFRA